MYVSISICIMVMCNSNLCAYQYFVGDLGLPMITLDCTTDIAMATRSINATWRLQSFLPTDIQAGRFNAVPDCNIRISCGNGHTVRVCTYMHTLEPIVMDTLGSTSSIQIIKLSQLAKRQLQDLCLNYVGILIISIYINLTE